MVGLWRVLFPFVYVTPLTTFSSISEVIQFFFTIPASILTIERIIRNSYFHSDKIPLNGSNLLYVTLFNIFTMVTRRQTKKSHRLCFGILEVRVHFCLFGFRDIETSLQYSILSQSLFVPLRTWISCRSNNISITSGTTAGNLSF